MNLVNMKRNDDAVCEPCPREAYPYGLRICLNDEQCKALGITGAISPGATMNVIALTTVVMCRQEKEPGAEDAPEIYLDLQITDMAIAPPSKNINAASLYSNSKMEK